MKSLKSITLLSMVLVVAQTIWGQGMVVRDMNINSDASDYSPVFYEDGIIFCSHRKGQLALTTIDSLDNHTSDLYFTTFGSGQETAKPRLFAEELMSQLNEGPATFSSQGDELFFTANMNRTNTKLRKNKLGIFESHKIDGKWSSPTAFVYNSSDHQYDVAHPVLSNDGQRLVFCSNMKGGEGKNDLYICTRAENGWSEPINLGKKVNTRGNEMFPAFDEKGRLYFSSDGRDLGFGMDIFYTYQNAEGNWCTPIRLDEPINSEFDDFGVAIGRGGESGFFSSNRNGGDDILAFEFLYPVFGGCNEIQKPILCYLIEEEKIVPNDTLPFVYEWDFGDGTTERGLSVPHCFPGLGEYHIALNIYDTLTGHTFAQVSEIYLNIEKQNQPYITSVDTVLVGENIAFDALETDLDNFELDEFYWDMGDGTRKKGDSAAYRYTSPGSYYVVLGAVSMPTQGQVLKTCAYKEIVVVDSSFVQSFSQEPLAQMSKISASNILVNDGVNGAEIQRDTTMYYVQFKASEEQIPLNDPYFEGVAYEITERYVSEDSSYRYSVGEALEVAKLYNVYRELLDSGYAETVVKDELTVEFSEQVIKRGVYMPDSVRAEINKKINKFSDIRFALNSHELSPSSFNNLDYIVEVMTLEPGIKLHVMAHTDNLGSPEFNQDLSERRAQSVREYLKSKGISESRLITAGYGNSVPKSTNDTEEGRALNRRVEFEIIVEESR